MKLATYRDGSRDGQLVVVSRDLSQAHYATGIANTLQQVLDDWTFLAPQLQDLSSQLQAGRARHAFPFDPQQCLAPLPRAYQWAVAAAFPAHAELAQRAGADDVALTANSREPCIRQAASDDLRGPCDTVNLPSAALGIDAEAGLAAVLGDVRCGTPAEQAGGAIRLLALACEITLRQLLPAERAAGAGLVHSKPTTVFSPVAVTPDELGEAWVEGRVRLTLQTACNGRKLGLCDAGAMAWSFPELVAHLARTRNLRAGTLLGTGPVSVPGVPAEAPTEWPQGHSCLAEKRWAETLLHGQPRTSYLQPGDTVRVEMKGRQGQSLFGAIELEMAVAE